jgi:hypothetical protein
MGSNEATLNATPTYLDGFFILRGQKNFFVIFWEGYGWLCGIGQFIFLLQFLRLLVPDST